MEIRWLEDALADITGIYRYIAADGPRAAAPYRGAHPGSGRPARPAAAPRPSRPLARETPADHSGHTYIVPYRVQSEVLHQICRIPTRAKPGPLDGQYSGFFSTSFPGSSLNEYAKTSASTACI